MKVAAVTALALVTLAAVATLLWHMQRPRPRKIAISFARFVPPLTPTPDSWHRIAFSWPRDLPALACLMAALGLIGWTLIDDSHRLRAAHPGHIGLRIVLDASHSMVVMDGNRTRYRRALDRIDTARSIVANAQADSLCLEITAVAAAAGPVLPLSAIGPLPTALPPAPMPEGSMPAHLLDAAFSPDNTCSITHILVVTDAPRPGAVPARDNVVLLWDQVGTPVANIGLHGLALDQAAFSLQPARLRIDGVTSGAEPPSGVQVEGPGDTRDAEVIPSPEADGRWSATTPFAGPGHYRITLPQVDGYDGDDVIEADITAPAALPVDWRLDDLPRPDALAQGSGLLVAPHDAGAAADRTLPALFTYRGFSASPSPLRIGAFLDDPPLLEVLSLDALESAMPAPFPEPLPPGFVPVLTDDQGGVIMARRLEGPDQARGLLVPAPRTDLPEPARSLSVTLFFSALADIAAAPATRQDLLWRDRSGHEIANARLESMTARPLADPAELRLLVTTGTATRDAPLWPLLVVFALAALAAERGLRLWPALRRGEAMP